MKIKRAVLIVFFSLINALTFAEALMPSGQSTSQSETILGAINGIIQTIGNDKFSYQPVTSISIEGYEKIEVGEVKVFSCNVEPKSATFPSIIWESSDTSIATVSKSARVKGIKKGVVQIKAISEDNAEIVDVFNVQVVDKPSISISNIEIINAPNQLKRNISYIPNISISPTDYTDHLEYVSSSPDIASFENGVIRTYQSGLVTFTVSSVENSAISTSFSIEILEAEGIKPSSISLDIEDTYYVNRKEILNSKFLEDAVDDNNLSVQIEDESVAKYDGKILGLKEGETSIKVCRLFDNDICSPSYPLIVSNVNLTNLEIEINGEEKDLIVGKKLQLRAAFSPSDVTLRDVEWSIEGDGAIIGQNGLAVGLEMGIVRIKLKHIASEIEAYREFDVKKPSTLTKYEMDLLHSRIRKIVGHFGLFALNGVVTYLMFNSFEMKKTKVFLSTLSLGLSNSIIAELLQLIPEGRSCQISDMFINFIGFIIGFAFAYLIVKLIKKRHRRKNN